MSHQSRAWRIAVARFLLPAHVDAQSTGVAFTRPTRTLLALGLIAFCVVLGEGAMADWSAVYLNITLRAGMGLAAAGYAAFSLVMAGGRGVGDRLTARFGPMIMVRLGGLVAALGLTLALVFTWVPMAILGFGLVGAGFSIVFPLTLSAAGRTTKQASGTAIAAVATCGYVGFLVGPPVIGFAADALSLRIALGEVERLSLRDAIQTSLQYNLQVDIAQQGLPNFFLVGLASTAVKEARDVGSQRRRTLRLRARAHQRVLRVPRAIADLAGDEQIQPCT